MNKIKSLIRLLAGNVYARLVLLDRASNKIKISYGHIFDRPIGGYLHGGQVKTYNLQKNYPEFRWKFNCIYLVSSALPFYIPDACSILKKRGFKIVLNQNGVAYPSWTSKVEEINRELRKVYMAADVIIYQSQFAKKSCDRWLGKGSSSYQIIFNPVDLSKFRPKSFFKNDLNEIKILSASSFQSMESINLIINTAKLLRKINFKWQIAGKFLWKGGEEQVKTAIASMGLTKYFEITGIYKREDAPNLFQRSDIFVHLNTSMDVCPTSVIEALGCGLPVVGLNSGGMPELVDDNSGVLVSYEYSENYLYRTSPLPESIYSAINCILLRLKYYSSNARRRAEIFFDEKKWLENHDMIFKKLESREINEKNI